MKSMIFACIAVCCLFPAVFHGCAPVTMTPSEARGFCMSANSFNDTCLDQTLVCDNYARVMAGTYSSAEECRRACDTASLEMGMRMPTMGCGRVSARGRGYCTQYCNYNYPH